MNLQLHRYVTILIALVWFVNGLFCKVLNMVPRHQQIVERILGSENSRALVVMIGILEIIMALWIVSRFAPRTNARLQMAVVMLMNILEFFFARDLLFWGSLNIVFAFIFISLIYFNEFILQRQIRQ